MTAAHCIDPDDLSVGSTIGISTLLDPDDPTVGGYLPSVTVRQLYIHPSYTGDDSIAANPTLSSPNSYDVAVIYTNGNVSAVPAVGVHGGHVGDGQAGMLVAYGLDAYSARDFEKQYWGGPGGGGLTTASAAALGASPRRYAHQLLTIESGGAAQSSNNGDSGGPLFRETSSGSGAWEVMGLDQNGDTDDLADPATSGFARLANVGRWLANPHNLSLTPSTMYGQTVFIQQRSGACVFTPNSSVGTRPDLGECEGYDPNIHSMLWQLVRFGTTDYFQIRVGKPNVQRCWDIVANTNKVALAACDPARPQQRWKAAAQGTTGLFFKLINEQFQTIGALQPTTVAAGGPLIITRGEFTRSQDWMIYR